MPKNSEKGKKSIISEIKELEDKINRNNARISQMYIDKIDGIISPDEFLKYREKYNLESQNAQARIDVLNAKLIEMSGVNNPFDAKLVLEKYKHIDVLIFEIANEFINKVYVGKLKEDGTREF